jgi:hypothetical protein
MNQTGELKLRFEVESIPSVTDVSAAETIVSFGSLGRLKRNKLDRNAVENIDSMIYTDKSQFTTNNIYWTDKVKIRYDNNWFRNVIYYEGTPVVREG